MQYMNTLHKVMPKVCKLLRYDYGSPGLYFSSLYIHSVCPLLLIRTALCSSQREKEKAKKEKICQVLEMYVMPRRHCQNKGKISVHSSSCSFWLL